MFPFVNYIFSTKKRRQAVLVHFTDRNIEVQGCSITLPRSQWDHRKARERSCLSTSQLILDILHILQCECVCVKSTVEKTNVVQRTRILCCCLLANFSQKWNHLKQNHCFKSACLIRREDYRISLVSKIHLYKKKLTHGPFFSKCRNWHIFNIIPKDKIPREHEVKKQTGVWLLEYQTKNYFIKIKKLYTQNNTNLNNPYLRWMAQ